MDRGGRVVYINIKDTAAGQHRVDDSELGGHFPPAQCIAIRTVLSCHSQEMRQYHYNYNHCVTSTDNVLDFSKYSRLNSTEINYS
mgnify:CR=1 FL=1